MGPHRAQLLRVIVTPFLSKFSKIFHVQHVMQFISAITRPSACGLAIAVSHDKALCQVRNAAGNILALTVWMTGPYRWKRRPENINPENVDTICSANDPGELPELALLLTSHLWPHSRRDHQSIHGTWLKGFAGETWPDCFQEEALQMPNYDRLRKIPTRRDFLHGFRITREHLPYW